MATKEKKNRKRKINKKPISKPKNQTKSSSKKPEFERAWKEYNSALNGWKESLVQWQKATNETLMTYHDACQKAIESDAELLKKVSSSWENTWEEIGPGYIKQQTKMIEDIFKETNIDSIKNLMSSGKNFLKPQEMIQLKPIKRLLKDSIKHGKLNRYNLIIID